jgi:hypothetical protein
MEESESISTGYSARVGEVIETAEALDVEKPWIVSGLDIVPSVRGT